MSTTTPTTKVLAGYGPSLWTGRSLLVVNAESDGAGAAFGHLLVDVLPYPHVLYIARRRS